LRVPGTLSYRNIAVRVVTDAAKRVGRAEGEVVPDGPDDEFEAETVSAFGEAFNNVAIHGYEGITPGDVEIAIDVTADSIVVEIVDMGHTFDPALIPDPQLETLPEGGMGLFIIRSFVDDVEYEPGPPNVLRLKKRRARVNHTPSVAPTPVLHDGVRRSPSDRV
jgi:serine/threonine-protein kinase RsbW